MLHPLSSLSLHFPSSSSSSSSAHKEQFPVSMAFSCYLLYFLLASSSLCLALSNNDDLYDPAKNYAVCLDKIPRCNASLFYHNSFGLSPADIALYYNVSVSQIEKFTRRPGHDYLVTVPCSCMNVNRTIGYFYNTTYTVRENDTFVNISSQIYSGQAYKLGNEESIFQAGITVPMYIMCGCVDTADQIVVTYTVRNQDTLLGIAQDLWSDISSIENINTILNNNADFINLGWVLFVPMSLNGPPHLHKKGIYKWTIVIGVLAALLLCSVGAMIIILRLCRSRQNNEEDPKIARSRTLSAKKAASSQAFYKENMEDFESERPLIFSLEEIEEATKDFDESKKIGEGGYGKVYFGVLGGQEVAIKKMRSSKSKEFFAELKVLAKIHHINVVELLGYASDEDHFYLIYEYVRNGSLNEHLHDPLLKGHRPLSWLARAQIALDAAKGVEYIHDHTKARYVHRDIKTSNILLDESLRAKVADFGLAKLVGRTNDEDFIATRLVGTPGYLPPESVKELQVTPKTDVFAFGVVLAELITGQRALIYDNREPNRMRSLITVVNRVFSDSDPEAALVDIIDGNLHGDYPMDDVYMMAELADLCISEEAMDRPEMREVVVTLSKVVTSSIEWEASLGGNSQVFSGMFTGR